MTSVPAALYRLLLPLLLLIQLHQARVYKKCELARELKHRHGMPGRQIATWVCIAKHESNYDTAAVNRASGDHGLFQISDVYWCSPPGSGYACNRPCSAFEDDDIADDVVCIRRIFNEHRRISGDGFNAWVVYPLYCKGDVTSYTAGCFDNTSGEEQPDHHFNATTEKPAGEEEDEDVYEFPPLPVFPKIQDVFASNLSDGYDLEANFSYPAHPQEALPGAGARTGSGGNEDVTIKYYRIQKEPAFVNYGTRTGSRNEDITIKYYEIEKEPAFENLGSRTDSGFERNRQNFYHDISTKKYHIQKEPSFKDAGTTTSLGFEGNRQNFYDDTTTKNYQIYKESFLKDIGTTTSLDFEANRHSFYEDTVTKSYEIHKDPSFKDSDTRTDTSLGGNRQNLYEDSTTKSHQNKDKHIYKEDNVKKLPDQEDNVGSYHYSYKDVTTKTYQSPNTFNNYYDKTTTKIETFPDTTLLSFGDHTTRHYITFQSNDISTTEKSQLHRFNKPHYQEITTKEPYKARTSQQSRKPTIKKSDGTNNDDTATSAPLDVDSTKKYRKGRTRPFRFTTFKPFTFRSLPTAKTKTYQTSITFQETTAASTSETTTSRKYDKTSEKSNTLQEPRPTVSTTSSTTSKKYDFYSTTRKHAVPFTFKPLPPIHLPRPVNIPLPTRKPITFKPFTSRRPLPIKPFPEKLPFSFKPFITRRPFAKLTPAGRSLSTFESVSTKLSPKPFTLKPFTPFTKKYHASDKKVNATTKTTNNVSSDTITTPIPNIPHKTTRTQFSSIQKPSTTTVIPSSSSSTTRRPFSTIFPTRKITNKNTSGAIVTSEAPPSSSREAKHFKGTTRRKEAESTKQPLSRQLHDPSDSKASPHQTFYGKADELQYNFFTKTYGFKLVGQF